MSVLQSNLSQLLEVCMAESRGSLLFLAVEVAEGKEHPRSVKVADALRRENHNAIVLPTLEEARIAAKGSWVIPLVDDHYGVNRWSPRPITMVWTPHWARTYSTSGWWIAVGKPCVTLSEDIMAKLACQVARRFSLVAKMEESEDKFGPPPSEKKISRRSQVVAPSHAWSQFSK